MGLDVKGGHAGECAVGAGLQGLLEECEQVCDSVRPVELEPLRRDLATRETHLDVGGGRAQVHLGAGGRGAGVGRAWGGKGPERDGSAEGASPW